MSYQSPSPSAFQFSLLAISITLWELTTPIKDNRGKELKTGFLKFSVLILSLCTSIHVHTGHIEVNTYGGYVYNIWCTDMKVQNYSQLTSFLTNFRASLKISINKRQRIFYNFNRITLNMILYDIVQLDYLI